MDKARKERGYARMKPVVALRGRLDFEEGRVTPRCWWQAHALQGDHQAPRRNAFLKGHQVPGGRPQFGSAHRRMLT